MTPPQQSTELARDIRRVEYLAIRPLRSDANEPDARKCIRCGEWCEPCDLNELLLCSRCAAEEEEENTTNETDTDSI